MLLSKPMSLSLPIIFISIAAVSIGVNFNFSNLITTSNFTTLSSMFKPPYVYVIINLIIIAIAASARFGGIDDQSESSNQARQMISVRKTTPSHLAAAKLPLPEMNLIEVAPAEVYESNIDDQSESSQTMQMISVRKTTPSYLAADTTLPLREMNLIEVAPSEIQDIVEEKTIIEDIVVTEVEEKASSEDQAALEEDDLGVVSRSVGGDVSVKFNSAGCASSDFLLPVTGKPVLLSRRFGHRKPHKSSSDGGSGRALEVARPKREETLEATWKMITEGRHVPLTRHLKKSEALDNQSRRLSFNKSRMESTPRGTLQNVSESEALTCLINSGQRMMMPGINTIAGWSPKPIKMKRVPSLSQDELNRRAEAFIKKFNEEMRLQREESLNRFRERMNR